MRHYYVRLSYKNSLDRTSMKSPLRYIESSPQSPRPFGNKRTESSEILSRASKTNDQLVLTLSL